jgi:molybdate transport system substrate-binding protein
MQTSFIKKSLILIVALTVTGFISAQEVRVAAAANLHYALEQIKKQYEHEHPKTRIEITYGPMGTLSQLILNGAPIDFFMAADKEYPVMLQQRNATIGPIVTYASGKLGMWSKSIDVSKGLSSVLLPSVRKIAIGNPTVGAIYGIRTVDILKKYGLYAKVVKKIVWGENISQVAQFAMSGNVEVAFFSRSIAISPDFKGKGYYYEFPDNVCPPLDQSCVLIKGREHNDEAAKFMNYILSDKCDPIWLSNGYSIPSKR